MERRPRPAVVAVALVLLWSVQMGQLALLAWSWEMFTSSAYLAVAVQAVGIWFFITFLVAMIHRGYNWARITYLVLSLITLPLTVYQLWTWTIEAMAFLVRLLDFALHAAAAVLLLVRPAPAWFRSRATWASSVPGP